MGASTQSVRTIGRAGAISWTRRAWCIAVFACAAAGHASLVPAAERTGFTGSAHERLPLVSPSLLPADSLAPETTPPSPGTRGRIRISNFSIEQALNRGTGGPGLLGSRGSSLDDWADGADARGIPDVLLRIVGNSQLRPRGHFDPLNKYVSRDTVQMIGRAFENTWTPVRGSVGPDAALTQRFGESFNLLGRNVRLDESAHWRRAHSLETSHEREYLPDGSPIYDYNVERGVASTRLGGAWALAVTLARGQRLRARGTYDRDSDDEGRSYDGRSWPDRGASVAGDRLMYVQRAQWSGDVRGEHAVGFAGLRGLVVSWSAAASRGYRLEPDRREALYLVPSVTLFDSARRDFGDTRERSGAGSLGVALPLGRAGDRGALSLRWQRESSQRDRAYRRFDFQPAFTANPMSPPESLFAPGRWAGYGGALINESTQNTDNGRETSRREVYGTDVDVALTPALRLKAGARRVQATLETGSFLPWAPAKIVSRARLQDADVLPALAVSWRWQPAQVFRLSADRDVSWPTLRQVAPASNVDLRGGVREQGNPALRSARVDRVALSFEGASATNDFTLKVFRMRLRDPIENVISGKPGAWTLSPANSGEGGVEGAMLGVRAGMGGLARALEPLSVTVRAASSTSRVSRGAGSSSGTARHPWAEAEAGAEAALTWTAREGAGGLTVTLHHDVARLDALGASPRPDIWRMPVTVVNATLDVRMRGGGRFTLAGDNITDAAFRSRQGALETFSASPGPVWSALVSLGR